MRPGQLPIDEDQNFGIPKNVITRSLGPHPNVQIDLEGPFPAKVGDIFLLCTDGLTGQVRDEELGPILADLEPNQAARLLVDLANLRGGPDNLTVSILKIVGSEITTQAARAEPLTVGGQPEVPRTVHPAIWVVTAAATSGRAVEAAGDVDTLLLDKTGTITYGNRLATALVAIPGVNEKQLAEVALLASLADETPEGRSIVALCKRNYGLTEPKMFDNKTDVIPFSATTRISGIDVDGRKLRKGAVDAILKHVEMKLGSSPSAFREAVDLISRTGGTPLGVAENGQLVGVIHLKDVVKPDIKQRFSALRAMGIRTVMVTGDNPITAATIASEAGVDDFIAEATPEDKLSYIRSEQKKGRMIAMCGDGTNDAPALAQADVGVTMQSGTQAAREAGNMVDLDSNPTKLIEIVEIGKQLLMTRGSLTTFSIANDVAKYFAIIPALFVVTYPELGALNVMQLASPQSAILSAIIFNALIIIALIPLALKGIAYRPIGASAVLRRNLLVYGLGGLIVPFIGIKFIDLIVATLHLA